MVYRGNCELKGRCARMFSEASGNDLGRGGILRAGCRQGRDVGPWGLDGGQGVQCPPLVYQLDVGVASERQRRRRVPRQFLGDLDVRPALNEAADVRVAEGVEVGHAVCSVAVGEEVRLLPFAALLFAPGPSSA